MQRKGDSRREKEIDRWRGARAEHELRAPRERTAYNLEGQPAVVGRGTTTRGLTRMGSGVRRTKEGGRQTGEHGESLLARAQLRKSNRRDEEERLLGQRADEDTKGNKDGNKRDTSRAERDRDRAKTVREKKRGGGRGVRARFAWWRTRSTS